MADFENFPTTFAARLPTVSTAQPRAAWLTTPSRCMDWKGVFEIAADDRSGTIGGLCGEGRIESGSSRIRRNPSAHQDTATDIDLIRERIKRLRESLR